MTRRGKCRCGTVLLFEQTALGYKTRCPGCRAVVRLRLDGAASQARQAATAVAVPPVPPPLPAAETQAAGTTLPGSMPPGPPDFSFLCEHEPTAPPALTEMEVYRGPVPRPSRARLWVFVLVAVVVVLGVGTAALLWG